MYVVHYVFNILSYISQNLVKKLSNIDLVTNCLRHIFFTVLVKCITMEKSAEEKTSSPRFFVVFFQNHSCEKYLGLQLVKEVTCQVMRSH